MWIGVKITFVDTYNKIFLDVEEYSITCPWMNVLWMKKRMNIIMDVAKKCYFFGKFKKKQVQNNLCWFLSTQIHK